MKFTYNAGDQPLAGYIIKRAIHRGGFGEVYYAQTEAGKDVALKLLHENHEVELRGVRQCLNLKHPQLVTIFDIKTDAHNDYWVVMEYVSGQTLAEKIHAHPEGMSVTEVHKIFQQICRGLQFMHARNLVHRDLKPANIFVEGEQIKIGDIGLSKFIGPSRRSAHTQSVGTVHYMAPEIAKGNYGVGVDIYALGIILYEMLTGRVPFEGESTAEILMKHLTATPDLSALPSQFRPVVKKALEKQFEWRYQSTDEFAAAFAAAAGGQGIPPTANDSPTTDRHPQHSTCRPCQRFSPPQAVVSSFATAHQYRWGTLVITIALLFVGLYLLRAGYLRGLIPGLIFSGAILYFWYRFHRSTNLPPQRSSQVSTGSAVADQEIVQKFKPPAKPPQHLLGWLQGLLMTPVVLAFITGSIALFSTSFFGSVAEPNRVDLGQLGFFYFSTVLLCWSLLTGTRFVAIRSRIRRRSSHGRRLAFAVFGFAAGAGLFSLQEYMMVQFPESQFSARSQGLFHSVGDQPLAIWKEVGPGLGYVPAAETENSMPAIASVRTPGQVMIRHDSLRAGHLKPVVQTDEVTSSASVNSRLKFFSPTWAGYGLFFGMLFGLRNWSAVVNEQRDSRLQWFSVAVSICCAYLVCCLLTFPTIWAVTWAAAMTAALQLTSPVAGE